MNVPLTWKGLRRHTMARLDSTSSMGLADWRGRQASAVYCQKSAEHERRSGRPLLEL